MNKYCPNKNSKEYKELAAIFGDDKAHFLWKRNHDSLDKAPNGADSKLFLSLLDYYKGDREKALIAKAKTLTDEFFNWFGDWTSEDKLNVSKVVDENGEPLVVWHSSKRFFAEFKHEFGGDETGARDSEELFFFMTDRNGSSWYSSDRIHNDFKHTLIDVRGIHDYAANVLFGGAPEITYTEEVVGGKTYKIPNTYYKDELLHTYDSDNDCFRSVFKSGIVRTDSMFSAPFVLSYNDSEWFNSLPQEMQEEIKKDFVIPKNADAYISAWLAASRYIDESNESYDIDAGALIDFDPSIRSAVNKYFVRPFYLDIKNIEDASSVKKGNIKKSIADYVSHNNYDGFVIHDTVDSNMQHNLTDVYAVRNSSLIKHVENEGTYSGNDVYKNVSDKTRYDFELSAARDAINRLNGILGKSRYSKLPIKEREDLKNHYRTLFENWSKHFVLLYGYDRELDSLYAYIKNKNTISISNWKELLGIASEQNYVDVNNLGSILEHLSSEVNGSSYHMNLVISVLKTALRGKRISFSFTSKLPIGTAARYDHFSNTIFISKQAAFRNDNRYRDLLALTILHELLHAITVLTIQHSPELRLELERLLEFVKKTLGSDANEYGLTDIYEFLAELSNEEFIKKLQQIDTNSEKKPYLPERGIINRIREFIIRVINRTLRYINQKHRGTAYADAMKLLLKSVFPLDFKINLQLESIDGKLYFDSISAQHKTDQEIAEGITKRFNVLYRAYEKMPNKDAKREQLENKIFEVYNELQLNQDLQAVRIALDFAIERIGVIDNATGLPTNNNSVLGYLTKLSQTPEPFSNVTPLNLVDAYSNSIGFFENLLENYIPDLINTKLTTEDRFKISELRTSIASAKALWTQAMVVVGDKIVDLQIDNEVDASDEDKADMKIVAKDWLHKNIMYGDISSFTSYVFNYGYSTNPIIKQAFHLIQHAETKTLEEIHPIAQRVARDFRAADKGFKLIKNWQTILQEHDYKGIPTGYFIRETNYGQYEQDLEAFIKLLNDRYTKDYGHTYIDDGNGIIINSLTGELAEEEEWIGGVEPTYIKYLKEIEHWKCEHAHRRYTEKYYMERMSEPYKGSLDPMETNTNKFGHGLSPKTLSRYNHIQSNINYYLDKCSDPKTNLTYPERLNDQDKASLDAWKDALDQLQNPYNEDGTPKSDDDRQMAFEIRAWQKWLGDKLRTDVKMDEFQDELLKVQEDAAKTGNYKPVYDFVKYNSRVGINPYFIEQTIGKYSRTNPSDQDVIHAQYLRQALLNLVKTSSGYTRDLSKMENRPEFWLNCKHMDQIIEDGKAKQDPDFAKAFDENFGFDEILYRDEYGFAIDSSGNQVKPEDEHMHNDLRTYRQYIIDKYTNLAYNSPTRTILGLNDATGNPIIFNGTIDQVRSVIEKLFSYKKETVDSAGNISIDYVPLTIFSMMTPKKDTFFNTATGRDELTMILVPSGRFAEKYDSNNYINTHYDKSNLNAEQPRHDYSDSRGNVYDNTKAYNEVMSNGAVARLYDTLIDTMQLAQDAYSTKNRRFNYRLPQIEADGMQIMSRLIQNGFKNTASALFESLTTVQENDESMRTKDDYMTSPDGSVATDVPLKFVRKLKDPSRLTTDVVGSVILFMNMALNYKNKSAIDAELKTLKYNMDPNFRSGVELEKDEFAPGDDQESVDMFDSMLNNHMYNNQWVKAPQTGADSRSMVAWKKAMRKVHRLETTQMLALNLFSMIVGFGDSMTRIFKESIMGKYMTIVDSVTSLADILVRYTVPVIANIGNPVANNKLTRAMQKNGISKGVHLTYEHANYGRVRKIFYNILMGGFSMLDWMANALLLRSFYNNIRLYHGGVVETGFYSLYELELAFVKAGHKKSEAILAHTMSTRTLWGAYDKYMNLKPEFSDEDDPNFICHVSQKTKTRVRTKTLQRSALYNGMNPDNDLPTYKTKLIGVFVGAMRGWLTQAIEHLFAGGSDNVVKNVHRVEDYKIKLGKTFKIHRTVADKLTDEQRERRMSWNYETGTPNDQIYIGLARSFNTLGKKLWRYATLNAADAKKAKFSYVEKYAWRDALVYMGILGLCLIAWPMLNEQAAAVPPPKDRESAGPMDVTDVPRWFNERYIGDQYWKMLASDIGFRIIESQITSIDPTSAMDVVNSITTLQSGVNEHIGLVKAAGDVLGVSGHSMDEVVKQGGYKYYTRGERNLYKALGPLDNMKTAFTYYGIKTNQDFYTNTYGGIYRFFGYDFKHEKPKDNELLDLGINADLGLDLGLDLDL